MKPFLQKHKLRLKIVSPVHIGNGEVLDPSCYTVEGDTLYVFDPMRLAQNLSAQQHQRWLNAADNVLKLQNFFKELKKETMEAAHAQIQVTPSIAEDFRQKIGKIVNFEGRSGSDVINALSFMAHIREGNGRLYIPGSSVKGALKTAFFQHYLNNKEDKSIAITHDRRDNPKFSDEWFGTFDNDIFSKFKIGDFHAENPESRVVWAIDRNRKKGEEDDNTLSQRFETLLPENEFLGDVTLLKKGENRKLGENFKAFPFDTDEFRIIVKNFYLPLLKKEIEWAKKNENLIPLKTRNRMIRAFNDTAAKKGFVFKVGMHSGAEAMTLDGIRKIEIPQAKEWVDEPYTYWLASETKDGKDASFMGWVYAEFHEIF